MPDAVRRALAVTLGAGLLLLTAGGAQALAARSTKKANAGSTLASLVNQTKSLPRAASPSSAKPRLLRRARHIRSVAAESPCGAVKT